MNILITGATGFLGGFLLQKLGAFNFKIFDRQNEASTEWQSINGVIHCAGLAHHSHDKVLTGAYWEANVHLTKRLRSAFQKSSGKFFIFISTATVYENFDDNKAVTETDVGKSLSVYAESKLAAEQELLEIKDKKVFILRPSVIVGPNAKGNIQLLEKLISKKLPIPVPENSSNNNLTDIRNITHVINQLILSFEEVPSGIYNINDDKKPNLSELLEKIALSNHRTTKLIKLPNAVFRLGICVLRILKPSLSKKLSNLFFGYLTISNSKIKTFTDLPYNSFE